MSNKRIEDSSDEDYMPKRNKNRNSWPTKALSSSTKIIKESKPFSTASQISPKKGSKRGSNTKSSNNTQKRTGRWTSEEHRLFLEAIEIYGRDWKKVETYVGTRTSTQARSHAQKVLPHPSLSQANIQSHNSSSTTMTKGSPPSVKNFPLEEAKYEVSNESDDGISDFIFKVEKVRKPIIGRDRVNSENNVFRFKIGSQEFDGEETSQNKNNSRKLSMNNDNQNIKNDLIGSPIQESIKEQFNEDEEEEMKDSSQYLQLERQKTFQPTIMNRFGQDSPPFSLNHNEKEMNLDCLAELDADNFEMVYDDGLGLWNSLEMNNNNNQYQYTNDKDMNFQDVYHHSDMEIDSS